MKPILRCFICYFGCALALVGLSLIPAVKAFPAEGARLLTPEERRAFLLRLETVQRDIRTLRAEFFEQRKIASIKTPLSFSGKLYYARDGGYLIVSSQGSDTFFVYDRHPPHAFVKSFQIVDVNDTDGIDVTNVALSDEFPFGIFTCHDDGRPSIALVVAYEDLGLEIDTAYDPRTGEHSPLVDADSIGYIFDPVWSRDGKKVAFFWNRESAEAPSMGMWVKDMTDGSIWEIVKGVFNAIAWTADDEHIWALRYRMDTGWDDEVVKWPVKGGNPVPWVDLPMDRIVHGYIAMTPDGRKFVYPVENRHADAWIIENFDPDVKPQ